MIGNVSTVSASSGQVQRQPPARPASKKGLWIAVVAFVLVGGIVTAAVVAGGGDGAGSSVAAAGETDKAVDPGKPDDKTDPAGKTEAKPDPTAKTEAAKTEAAKTEAKQKPPVGSDAAEIDPDDILDEAMKQLDGMDPDMVPPEVRKQLEELKKMGKLTPAQQREKRKLLGRRGPATTAEADDPSGGGTSPPPPKAAWVTSHDLPGPAGFDPGHLDVSAFIRYAMAEARKADPDAVLFRIDVDGVAPDGFANLELPSVASKHGSLDLRFFSPARSKRDPKVPLGVPVEWNCEFRIEAEPGGVAIRPISGLDCSKNIPISAPRCSAKALWQRAIARKAPTNAVASLGYRAWSGNAKWYFDIGSGFDKVFSNVFDDGC